MTRAAWSELPPRPVNESSPCTASTPITDAQMPASSAAVPSNGSPTVPAVLPRRPVTTGSAA